MKKVFTILLLATLALVYFSFLRRGPDAKAQGISVESTAQIIKDTFIVTWGVGKTADTTAVDGAIDTDKYFLTDAYDATYARNVNLEVEALTDTLIIHASASDTGFVLNVMRTE